MTAAARAVWWSGTIAISAALAHPIEPLFDVGSLTIPAGVLVGLLLFATIARRQAVATHSSLPPRRLVARSAVLTLKSAQEEALWRALLLGSLVAPLGRLGALALATVLFSAVHVWDQGRRALVHIATGGVFGAVYVGTGRLSAAVAAHAAYNVAIGAASPAKESLSVSDTSQLERVLVRSPMLSARPPTADGSPLLPHPAPLAALADVHKSFGSSRALAGVSLEVYPGEVVGLLGPNGAGKSTAVSILLGLRRPDAGSARLLGRDPRDAEARRQIGVVLQDVGFAPSLRVREIVELVRAHYGKPVATAELLERVGLEDVAEKQAGGLSGGQRRGLAVALALAGRPEVLFLDEPTAGLDAGARRILFRELRAFAARGGAVLLTTQQLEEAEQLATRLVVLSRGRVLVSGTVAEIRAHSSRPRITLRADRLPPLPDTASVESLSDHHVVYVDDPDAFVAQLVRSGIPYRDLEISRVRLEEAFLALTEEE